MTPRPTIITAELQDYLAGLPESSFGAAIALIPVNAPFADVVASHLARVVKDSVHLVVLGEISPWLDAFNAAGWIVAHEVCFDMWDVIVAVRPGAVPVLPHYDEADLDGILNVLMGAIGNCSVIVPYASITPYFALRCVGSDKQTTVLTTGPKGVEEFSKVLEATLYARLLPEQRAELLRLITSGLSITDTAKAMGIDRPVVSYTWFNHVKEMRKVKTKPEPQALAGAESQYHQEEITDAD